MKKFVYAVFAVLLIAGLAFPVFAATTAPSWVSTESQNRVRQWFLKDQQEALYSTLGDLTDAGGFWATVGNTGTTAGTHFIGTVDARDLVFKTHNTEVFRRVTQPDFHGRGRNASIYSATARHHGADHAVLDCGRLFPDQP